MGAEAGGIIKEVSIRQGRRDVWDCETAWCLLADGGRPSLEITTPETRNQMMHKIFTVKKIHTFIYSNRAHVKQKQVCPITENIYNSLYRVSVANWILNSAVLTRT